MTTIKTVRFKLKPAKSRIYCEVRDCSTNEVLMNETLDYCLEAAKEKLYVIKNIKEVLDIMK